MSSGIGRLQRRVIRVLEAADGRAMDRKELETVLCEGEGYDPSNLLRAVRGLHERRLVYLSEGRTLETSRVSLPQPVRAFSDEEVARILEAMG